MVALTPPIYRALQLASSQALVDHPTISHPRQVGMTEVGLVFDAADKWKAHDMAHGGGAVYEQAQLVLAQSVAFLDAYCTDDVRPQLFTAVGYLHGVMGFAAFDTYRYNDASNLWAVALEMAREAGDPSLAARVLGWRARMDAWPANNASFNPRQASGHVDRAIGQPNLTHTDRAMLLAVQARAHAQEGWLKGTTEIIKRADAEFHEIPQDPEPAPPWVRHYGLAHHQGDTGRALADLVVYHGQLDLGESALERYTNAVHGHHAERQARSKQFTQTNIAAVAAAIGDLPTATTYGTTAITTAKLDTSRRQRSELELLRDVCAARTYDPSAQELSDAIGLKLLA